MKKVEEGKVKNVIRKIGNNLIVYFTNVMDADPYGNTPRKVIVIVK